MVHGTQRKLVSGINSFPFSSESCINVARSFDGSSLHDAHFDGAHAAGGGAGPASCVDEAEPRESDAAARLEHVLAVIEESLDSMMRVQSTEGLAMTRLAAGSWYGPVPIARRWFAHRAVQSRALIAPAWRLGRCLVRLHCHARECAWIR